MRWRNRSLLALAALAAGMAGPAVAPTAALASSSGVVISQVYGGGGNSGAPFQNDFVELFNAGGAPVSLNGWSLQYSSATGTGNLGANAGQLTELSGTLAPGQYALVQEGAGAGSGVPLPAPDVTDATPIAMSATAGKVALVTTTTPLGCNGGSTPCPASALATIVDLVGYGSADFFEGAGAAPTLSNTTAAVRGDLGCRDTDGNAADFAAAAPSPRNTASPTHTCGGDAAPAVATRTPGRGAADVAVDANVAITFTEPVDVAGAWYTISCSSSGAHTATASGGPTAFTLDPDADFAQSESCTVTVVAAQVTDQDTADPPDTMAADDSWSFTTVAPAARIHDIQGASHLSPLNGRTVSGVTGIVTAKRANGYYLQDPEPDGSDATSEGIFVFTSSAPAVSVGDAVRVGGRVSEFRPGGASSANLTTTELGSPTTTVLSSGNPLPTPVVIGIGGRVPPSQVIDDDANGNVETGGTFDPETDGIDFYESMEGMRVQLDDAVASGPTNTFGETSVLADNGANASVRTPRGGVLLRPDDANPERLITTDDIVPAAIVNVGDHFTAPLVGVLDYNFGNFMLELTSTPTAVHDGVTQESTQAPAPHQLSIGTFNVENLDPTDPASKFSRLASLIVNNLQAPDILTVEEVQDNDGAADSGVVSADVTLGMLTSAIRDAGGPAYQFREIDPVNDQDGGEPGGNIRQVFLFRTDRGVSFVDRPGGGSTTATTVVNGPGGPQLSASPGRVAPADAAWTSSRKPLAGEFLYQGHHLFVIGNHLNSKGGDQPLFGRFQPPTRGSEVQRNQQTQVLHDFVAAILAADPDANVVLEGDLNDFEYSDAVARLKSAGLQDLIETLPLPERYSYVFEGNSQTLDHVMVSGALAVRPNALDVVHVNAEFADRASDHDPSVALITLDAPDVAAPGVIPEPSRRFLPVVATATFTDGSAADAPFSCAVDYGDGTGAQAGLVVARLCVGVPHAYLQTGVFPVTVTVADARGGVGSNTTSHTVLRLLGGTRTLDGPEG
jgi:predicted extracellular nuclease